MRVDALERVGAHLPGRLGCMRLRREDEIDLHGAAQHQHPALLETEAIPLLGERLERGQQAWQRIGSRREVARVDPEVPVGALGRASLGPRPDEPDLMDGRVPTDEGDDAFVERRR
jgi:hypothetical protein